jgi:hypothetical protein
MNLHKAIRAIHSNVVTIYGDTQETIIAKDENGNQIDINWTQVNQQLPIIEQEIKDAEENAIAKKESAKAKLAALGLDEEEIKAIIGV